MTVLEYIAKFTELAGFGDDYVATDATKVRKFEDGLKLSIRGKIAGLNLQDMDSMISTALIIEREIDDARSIRDAGANDKKRESQVSSSSSRKKQRTSELLANQDRGCVSSATSLDTVDGIAPRDRDPRVMGHHSPNHHWGKRGHSLFLHTLVRTRGTSIRP